jgi:glycosyltransferase involved in cell wall biosynthesis
VPDVPIKFAAIEPLQRTPEFLVAVVCSFNYDEPIAEILDAARAMPDVRFMMTGNPRDLSSELQNNLPDNVSLTGFMPDPAYGGLLTSADVVMTLTTRDHTMLRAAYEAIYQGTPVIVSDWPILRSAFATGAIHVDSSARAIVDAVRRMASDYKSFRAGATELRLRKLEQWAVTLAELRAVLTA